MKTSIYTGSDQITSNVFIVHIDQYFDIVDHGEDSREFTVTHF